MTPRVILITLLACAVVPSAYAQENGTWLWRAGAHRLLTKSNNKDPVSIGDATLMTFDATYLPIPNFGLELFNALPSTHDVTLHGGGKVGETSQIPPTMMFQYRLFPSARLHPYLGLGVNYTAFFDEKTTGALRGSKLQIADSFGTTLQVGMDISIGPDWFLNLDARWMEMDTPVKLNGTVLGRITADPYAVGLSIGRNF